jgi:hypothetical protein
VATKAGLNRTSGTFHEDLLIGASANLRTRKHAARHKKEHLCKEPGCTRKEGFATINDLWRHEKSVHKIRPEHGWVRTYKCAGQDCSKAEKEWPRLDNFKQHLKRMHPRESLEELILKLGFWLSFQEYETILC